MDAITLEVMRNRFFAITEEMGAALIRTAYSTNIKDRRDCSCALFDVNGETIAQAEHIPVHSGVLPWGVKGALKHINKKELKPGDAIMHNDPFIGGTHLPDIIIFSPIFFKGELVAFVGNLAHHVDVGGKVPGSLTPDATEIFHEGICFPPVKIKKEGKVDPEIFAMFRSNIRTKYESSGDLMAQIAANNVGEKRFEELCDEMGVEVVLEAIAELENYCDRRMGAELEKLPIPDLDTVREKLANPNAEGFAINTKLYEENGIKLLAQNSGLQRHIFSTDKLIKVPKDLANETFRTYEDAIVNEFYGGLGNIAIMPYGELYTSLQNGLITATDQQIPSYIIENYYEVAPFYSYVGAQWTSYSLMMNLDKFNQYSEEDQKIFVDAAWACSEAEYESYKDMKADAEKFFDEKGITYYQPTDEELNQWKEYAASLSDKWRELIGEELYNQVSELFNY